MDNISSEILYKDGFFKGNNDLDIYYRGYAVKESKATIIISHGFCESVEKYSELIRFFNENNFSVYALDHRGHGKSGRLGIDKHQINVEKFNFYIDDFKIFLDTIVLKHLKDEKLFLFAHSMGGGIGALFLERYTDYFDAAILNCPMMEIETGNYPPILSKILSNIICKIGKDKQYIFGHGPFSKKSDLNSSGTSCEKRYNEYFNKQINYEHLQTSGGSFNWLNQSLKATNQLIKKDNAKKVEIPVLLFQAGRDTFVKPGGQNKFAKFAKNCTLIKIDDAKHEIYFEQDRILKPYLEKVIDFYNKNLSV
ncbi:MULTISPECIES: alpha/beta hydrolase [unclassified Romboutsia]|uniref:alpha/beta hydrolase n=1 Tax=unclassified Romboutsia TaxID=2626894 RepID=UPI000822B3C2|nr:MULTISPECIES: alpha/beta hydrolase [unclassified Romboutsia]SCH08194.1 lysophospholipase L2 [uncultured Clostridium sp.]